MSVICTFILKNEKICNKLITDLNELEPELRGAIDKFTLMMKATHKSYGKKNLIAGYVKYVLQEGSGLKKTRLVRNLRINLGIHDKTTIVLDRIRIRVT